MPVEEIYLATVIIDREQGLYKVESATVSGIQPHPNVREDHPDLFHNCYLVLRQFQHHSGNPGYPLIPGNIIKLGRVEYIVLQTKNTEVQTFKNSSYLELNSSNHVVEKTFTGTCKVCLCDENSEEDPLISPCFCKGSCQLIHASCLKNWINSKVKMDFNQIVSTFNFSKFQCEICQAPLPKTITHPKGNIQNMITISKPDRPYIVLESLSQKQQKKQRNLHLVSPVEGLPLKIGRGHQCEIRINDISVSRSHSEIRLEDGKFYLRDLKSKFGTLIKFKQQFEIKNKISFQYGRMCLNFKLITEHPKQESQTSQDDDIYHQ